jgi:malate dehydrogenase
MREVAIVGAGDIGGAAAHAIARLDVARLVRLIDERGSVAQGKALDIAQAAPVEGFATQLAGAADWTYAAGAELVVIADRFGAHEWTADEALTILRPIARSSPLIVCAGAGAAAIVDRAVRDLGIARTRVIGSAPEALASTTRALLALALDGSPRDAAVSVLGMPPFQTVIPWNDATFSGQLVTRLLGEPARRSLERRAAAAWPPGPVALAAAAARTVAGVDGRSRQLVSCFVAPDRSSGEKTRVAALPVRLGPTGVFAVVMPSLTAGEQVALDNVLLV